MFKDSFQITSDYIKKEIFDLDNFTKKILIPEYKKEIINLYDGEYKQKFETVTLNYDGKNKGILNIFPKTSRIETVIAFEETDNNFNFSIEGADELSTLILNKQNKGTGSGSVSQEELNFFLKKETNIKQEKRKDPKDQNLYMEDFYKEQNYYYEPTFNDHKFAERVEALFQKVVDNFLE